MVFSEIYPKREEPKTKLAKSFYSFFQENKNKITVEGDIYDFRKKLVDEFYSQVVGKLNKDEKVEILAELTKDKDRDLKRLKSTELSDKLSADDVIYNKILELSEELALEDDMVAARQKKQPPEPAGKQEPVEAIGGLPDGDPGFPAYTTKEEAKIARKKIKFEKLHKDQIKLFPKDPENGNK